MHLQRGTDGERRRGQRNLGVLGMAQMRAVLWLLNVSGPESGGRYARRKMLPLCNQETDGWVFLNKQVVCQLMLKYQGSTTLAGQATWSSKATPLFHSY